VSGGRTIRVMTAPLEPSRGIDRPLSSRLTPPALPMVRTKGPLDTHSRTSLAGIVSSLVRPSSVRTRIQVVSVVRATSRYGETTLCAVEEEAGTGAETLGPTTWGVAAGRSEAPALGWVLGGRFSGSAAIGGCAGALSAGSAPRLGYGRGCGGVVTRFGSLPSTSLLPDRR